jgi:predicted DNA-binding protein (MmcQ/YjbR family)
MTHKQIEEYILSLPGSTLDYPFGKDVAVYKLAKAGHDSDDPGKMFALIAENKDPIRISLKCDPQLAVLLREKYESVMPGYHLNKKHWNTVVLTGQLPWEEVQGLIRHSYELVSQTR